MATQWQQRAPLPFLHEKTIQTYQTCANKTLSSFLWHLRKQEACTDLDLGLNQFSMIKTYNLKRKKMYSCFLKYYSIWNTYHLLQEHSSKKHNKSMEIYNYRASQMHNRVICFNVRVLQQGWFLMSGWHVARQLMLLQNRAVRNSNWSIICSSSTVIIRSSREITFTLSPKVSLLEPPMSKVPLH